MKKYLLAAFGVLLLALAALILIPNVTREFDDDPHSLSKYLEVPIPASAVVTHLAALNTDAGDGRSRLLQSKVAITRQDFLDLVSRRGLVQGESAILPHYMFDGYKDGAWWSPPAPYEQFKLVDRYAGNKSTARLEYHLVMIWVEGVAYVYESKFEGQINR
jgi:hypothetical protein